MNQNRPVGTTIALVATILYGLGIGVLGVLDVLDVPNIGVIAAVGAILVAALWVVTGTLRSSGRPGHQRRV